MQRWEQDMQDVVVHGVPGSPFVRIVLLALEEKRVPYSLRRMQPSDMRSERHFALHPFGRIPIVEHGKFVLYESQAITRYVDALVPEPRLTPDSHEDTARMNQLIGIADWYVFPSISAGVVWNRVVAPRFGRPCDEDAVQAALPKARVCIEVLEGLLGAQTWFTGSRLSLADIQLAPHFDLLTAVPEGAALLENTRLIGWLERMRSRRSMQATRWEVLAAAA
jgi:glutathione S-transferase